MKSGPNAGLRAVLPMLLLAVATPFASAALGAAERPGNSPEVSGSSLAATVFSRISPAVIVLTTTLADSERRASHGSGFVIDERGWALTNFHVVADALFEPDRYQLHYRRNDGSLSAARVLAIDAINDLAIVDISEADDGVSIGWRAMSLADDDPVPALGEAVFALGNPLDLGLTVSQGSFSGVIEGSFESRMHLTGALNPGMSGGPAVDSAGRLVGVNVARSLNGELVSFLVPARLARDLVAATEHRAELDYSALRAEISRQLHDRQTHITRLALDGNWQHEQLGPYELPVFLAEHVDCGASSNDSARRPPPARVRAIGCELKTYAFPQQDNRSATLSYGHILTSPQTQDSLNPFQLAAAANRHFVRHLRGRNTMMGRQHCEDQFTLAGPDASLPVRVLWCVQPYREFEDVYDFNLALASQDRDGVVLVSRLSLEGFAFDNALELTRRFLSEIRLATAMPSSQNE